MRKVQSHSELTEINEQGEGYVVNDRPDRPMLHQAKCEALEAMTRKYDKLFFEKLTEAMKWSDKKYGTNGWEVCGRCRADQLDGVA